MRPGVVAAIIAGILVLVTGLAIGGVAIVLSTTGPSAGDQQASCQARFAADCADIPLPALEEAFGIDLPEGTEVVESNYSGDQSWRLTATFRLGDPAWQVPQGWEAGGQGVYRTAERSGERLTLIAFTS